MEIATLIETLKAEIVFTQNQISQTIEQEKLAAYWHIGKHIKLHLLQQKDRAVYGDYLFPILSEALGVEDTLLYKTVQFYESYPEIPAALRELTWTHIRSLLSVSNLEKRAQLEKKVRTEISPPHPALTTTRETPYIYKLEQIQAQDMIDLGFRIFISAKNKIYQ